MGLLERLVNPFVIVCILLCTSTKAHQNSTSVVTIVENDPTFQPTATASSGMAYNVLKDECSEVCERTFSPHTSTNGLESGSCNQGCKLFSIISATSDEPLKPCKSDCKESYDSESERNACSLGCSSQVNQDHQNILRFRSAENNLMRQAYLEQMMSHWMFQMMLGFDMFNTMYDTPEALEGDGFESENIVIVSSDLDGIHISDITILHPSKSVDSVDVTSEESVEFVQPQETYDKDIEQDLYCGFVNFNSKLLWCLLVFFSTMMLFWLSCNIITTAPKQRIVTKKSEEMKMNLPLYEEKGPLVFVAPPPIYTEKATLDRISLI